jgi:tagatose 6-phosphate kinase
MITTVTLNASIDKAYYMESSIENGTVMRVKAVHNSAGGKGLNVARAVHLCGEEVLATGLVGGYNGKYLEALLDKDGVSHDFVHIQGETRSCINILDEAYGSTEYLEPGCLVTGWEIQQFLKQFPEIIKESSVVTMSGSVPAGVGKEIYKELTDMVKTAGKQVILDTSGELLKQGIESCPTVVKPNQEELEMLFHTKIRGREDVIERAKEIREKGIPYVIVSLGGEGALMACREGVFQAVPPGIEAVNTVGCGDSMVGAVAAALHRGWEPEKMLRYAVAVASANALSPNTGDFDPAVSEGLFGQVECRRIC